MPQVDRALKAKPQGDQRRRGPNEDLVESGASPEQRELMRLQRLAGNAAVADMLQREGAALPNPDEETEAPETGSALTLGMGNVGKLLGESGVVASRPETPRPLATASGTVGGAASPNLGEAPMEPVTGGAGGTSGGVFGMGNIPKMLGDAGVLSGPQLPGAKAANGPAAKGKIGEELGEKASGAGPVAGAGPSGAGFIGGPLGTTLETAIASAGKAVGGPGGAAGGISRALTQAPTAASQPPPTAGGFVGGPVGSALSTAIGAAGKAVSGTRPAATDPRNAALAASADRFIRDGVALGVPGIAELAVQIRALLAKQGL